MKYFLIMNPASGGGKSRKHIQKVLSLFDERGVHYQYAHTSSLDNAWQLSKKANESGFDVVVAVGGDGTINAVLNGFYDDKGQRISAAIMGVVHTGTSPDFCKSYRIPVKTEKAVQLLLTPKVRKIKIGKMSCCIRKYQDMDKMGISDCQDILVKYFGCCANIGLGASLARQANGGIRKYAGDTLGTFLCLVKILFTFKPNTFSMVKNGREIQVDKLYNISVGLTYHIASGIKVRHGLTDSDDRFYCLTTRDLNVVNIASVLRQAYSGKQIRNSPAFYLDYCRTIEFYGNNLNPEVELDGDPAGFLPCKIEMAIKPLDLICQSMRNHEDHLPEGKLQLSNS